MELSKIDVRATCATSTSLSTRDVGNSWSAVPHNVSTAIAPLTSPSQAYYWSRVWQTDEMETVTALAQGEGRVFENAEIGRAHV